MSPAYIPLFTFCCCSLSCFLLWFWQSFPCRSASRASYKTIPTSSSMISWSLTSSGILIFVARTTLKGLISIDLLYLLFIALCTLSMCLSGWRFVNLSAEAISRVETCLVHRQKARSAQIASAYCFQSQILIFLLPFSNFKKLFVIFR